MAGAEKDLKHAAKAQSKLPEKDRNPHVLDPLEEYIELLRQAELRRNSTEDDKGMLKMLSRPKCAETKSTGLLPGQCPPGTGGGYLAGALNSLFDADLQPVCDKPQRRKDTEHEKHEPERDRPKD